MPCVLAHFLTKMTMGLTRESTKNEKKGDREKYVTHYDLPNL